MVMKVMVVILIILAVLFSASQIWAKSLSRDIEMYEYVVIKSFDDFEIRKYAPANFSYVTLDTKTYDASSSKGFRQLAGYIFGGNEASKEIAMTSPVEMEMDEKMTMKFMVPKEYALADLPQPNNKNVKFKQEPERIVAAIRFSGYANDKIITFYKKALSKLIQVNGLQHNGEFSFLGYNSPFDFFNRRNEVIVELKGL
jgi:hypothetical protein